MLGSPNSVNMNILSERFCRKFYFFVRTLAFKMYGLASQSCRRNLFVSVDTYMHFGFCVLVEIIFEEVDHRGICIRQIAF